MLLEEEFFLCSSQRQLLCSPGPGGGELFPAAAQKPGSAAWPRFMLELEAEFCCVLALGPCDAV